MPREESIKIEIDDTIEARITVNNKTGYIHIPMRYMKKYKLRKGDIIRVPWDALFKLILRPKLHMMKED